MFFDDYSRFLSTSETGVGIDRLNLRHEAMIADNVDVLRGARVLDLAAHDGRWAFAAIKAGAVHVTAVEARQHLVDSARESFVAEGVDPCSYELRCNDMFAELRTGNIRVDVVMCLGFMYHTLRYNELLFGMKQTGAEHIIVDTKVILTDEALLEVKSEDHEQEQAAAADEFTDGPRTVTAMPSVAALRTMFRGYGFRFEKNFDWPALAAQHPEAERLWGYKDGRRVTMRWVRPPEGIAGPTPRPEVVARRDARKGRGRSGTVVAAATE